MTAQQIYELALYHLRDNSTIAADRSLPPQQAIVFLNEAINEACRRSRLLTDRSTAAICSIPVVIGTALYDLDPRVIKVRNARLVTAARQLKRVYTADMDSCDDNWEDRPGSVDTYIPDYETGKIRLYRIPTAVDTLKLTVSRIPLVPLVSLADTPEIKAQYHNALAQYLVWRVRSIDDSEMYDPKKAAQADAEFEREFGPKRSAWAEAYEDTQPYPEDE